MTKITDQAMLYFMLFGFGMMLSMMASPYGMIAGLFPIVGYVFYGAFSFGTTVLAARQADLDISAVSLVKILLTIAGALFGMFIMLRGFTVAEPSVNQTLRLYGVLSSAMFCGAILGTFTGVFLRQRDKRLREQRIANWRK